MHAFQLNRDIFSNFEYRGVTARTANERSEWFGEDSQSVRRNKKKKIERQRFRSEN